MFILFLNNNMCVYLETFTLIFSMCTKNLNYINGIEFPLNIKLLK